MQISSRQFRQLILLYVVLFFLSTGVDMMFPHLMPAPLVKAQQEAVMSRFTGISAPEIAVFGIIGTVGTVLLVASLIGLYLFRPWARIAALVQTAAGLAFLPLFGTVASSGWASAAAQLLYMTWAAILALAYFSSVRERFRPAAIPPAVAIVEEHDPEMTAPAELPTLSAPSAIADTPLAAPPARRINAAAANLIAGLRTLLFMRPGRHGLHATWSQLMLFTATTVAIRFIADFSQAGTAGQFTWYGLPGVLFALPVLLLAAWGMARLASRPEQTLMLAVLFSAMYLPLDAFYTLGNAAAGSSLLRRIFRPSGYFYYLVLAWYALAAALAASRLLGMPARQRVFAALLALLVIGGAFTKVYRSQTVWAVPYDREAAANQSQPHDSPEDEDIFYLQPKLLERELAAVKPGRQGEANLYFIGAAGYSYQDVFMKEVRYVDALFKKRFGTEGRSVLLINNEQTARQSPIASATSLGLALKRVGAVMNKDKDILFLYLTSHGSQDHHFSLSFGSMQFNTLDPGRLRALLDESGIRHRVIVVSACYSGGFIEPLKTDNSLIITASAADRNSFGCSNEAEFTYFGKAYFGEALQKTDSFVDAFAIAKPIIAAREKKDDFLSSNPQIFVGKNIGQPLAEFARRGKTAAK